MIRVNNWQRKELERVGLLQHKRIGYNQCDANFTVVNKEHCGRDKSTYVVESREVMCFLGLLDGLNLQPISERQLNNLKQDSIVTEEQVQLWTTYKPNALVYQDSNGRYWAEKQAKIMLSLGIWKNNTSKNK